MSIRLCLGEYAKEGYEPEYMGNKVYCLEELCYFIKENAYLLDESFVQEGLGIWLDKECRLKELGEEIKRAARKRISLKAFVGILLDYSCFFSGEEREEIQAAIVMNSKRTIFEKKKARADALAGRGHYKTAIQEYRKLLNIIPEEQVVLRGEVHHGCGVCLARLFYFSQAGEFFLKAHSMTGRFASYKQYLWTKRLSVSEEEYIEFLKQHEEAYEDSIEMEDVLENLKVQWKESVRGLLMEEIHRKKEEYKAAEYQKLLSQRVEYLKDEYMQMVE